MKHYLPNIEPEHEKNFKKLSSYLRTLPEDYEHFDMGVFFDRPGVLYVNYDSPSDITPEMYNQCGTVACAVGHGPAAGITGFDGYWSEYAEEAFGAIPVDLTLENGSIVFVWCFGSQWSNSDNTPLGAADRIDYMLSKGIPEDYVDILSEAVAGGISYVGVYGFSNEYQTKVRGNV